MKKYLPLLLTLILVNTIKSYSQVVAFPGAEGAGKNTTGGRGTSIVASKVFAVTSLADDGSAGTLRWALDQSGTTYPYRTIIFRISGTIHLTSALKITKANTTIAGQTAPGQGICLADYPVSVSADNVIVRYIRFRMGDKNQNLGMVNGSGNDDAFDGTGRNHVIIDHCTMSWSDDEACSFYRGDSVTLQWNIISEPLNYSYHFETGDADFEHHGYGGIWGGAHATFHHNLIAHCQGRAPRFDGSRNLGNGSTPGLENADFVNNVIYNWGNYNANGGEGGNYNIINNYYKYGPSTSHSNSGGVKITQMVINPFEQASPALPYGKYYLSGNYVDAASAVIANNWLGAAFSGGNLTDTANSKVTTPFTIVPINTQTAADAYTAVLRGAGCSLPNRDTLDARIIKDVINRTGKIIDVQGGYAHGTAYAQTVNAWPALLSTTPPVTTNADNVPDVWLAQRGLTGSALSGAGGYHSNGYTHLENFLNGDTIVAPGVSNQCVYYPDITGSGSGKWINIKDTTYGYYASPNYLNSTDTNNIIASLYDDGSFGSVYGSYYTTNVTRYATGLSTGPAPYLNRNFYMNGDLELQPIITPVTVRLYFTKEEFNALKTANPLINTVADLAVYIDGTSGDVDNSSCITQMKTFGIKIYPGSYGTYGTYQTGYYLEFVTTTLKNFFIAGKDNPVPLRLISFIASQDEGAVQLNWKTENETNTQDFLVERSADGKQFTPIGTIAAKNVTSANLYSFKDDNAINGTAYYRLRINDKDGNFIYSTIATITSSLVNILRIVPNPATDAVTVYHPKTSTSAYLRIMSSEGKQIVQQKLGTGNTKTALNISGFPKGVYQLVFTNEGTIRTAQLIIQ
ncbi:T9SS type A sorting domain-containing protein [Ferruginibacter albus]|uniref:T9SS type A sorting domain-containing protein n=1 Tax=Ferruginibacter albus TaxID=2875540 RepID=UPI001CC42FDB|nr:T9SS type A sorting domain-containing protein [Ferruginibacter albus]UAY53653.1 T9SS type A sorting domain-containing protein [Ferruginibacter albus]